MTEDTRAIRSTELATLLAILAIALVLRLVGVGHLLPMLREDDGYVFDQADMLAGRATTWNRPLSPEITISKYPHALAWALIPFTKPAEPSPNSEVEPLAADLDRAAAPYRRGRILFALFSACAIPLIWFATRRAFGAGTALLAAGFVALSLLHLVLSKQARPHGPFATFSLAAVVFAAWYCRRPGPWIAAITGVSAAIAIGTLPFGWFLLPPLLIAWVLARRTEGRRVWHLLMACAIVAASTPLFYPYSWVGGGDLAVAGTHSVSGYHWRYSGLVELPRLFLQYDPVLALLASAGAVLVIARVVRRRPSALGFDRRVVLVIAAGVVPYWMLVGGRIHDQARFFLPLLPLAAALAAIAVVAASRVVSARFGSGIGRFAGAAVVIAAALVVPSLIAVKYATITSRPTTLDSAAAWLREHANPREDGILLATAISLPLYLRDTSCTDAELNAAWRPWERFLHDHPDRGHADERFDVRRVDSVKVRTDNKVAGWEMERVRRLMATGARFIVAGDTEFDRWFPLVPAAASRRLREIARISPFAGEPDFPVYWGFSDPEMFRRIWFSIAWGPPLVIYQVVN